MMLRTWQRIAILLLAPAAVSCVSGWLHEGHRAQQVEASHAEALRMVDGVSRVLWLDARSPQLQGERPLRWAIRLTEETWEEDLPKVLEAWQPGAALLVFCDSGTCGRSQEVAQRLRRETSLDGIHVVPDGVEGARWLHDYLARTKGASR